MFSFDEVEKKITDPTNLAKLRPEIEKHIDTFLREKLKDAFPMLSAFIGEKTINQLKSAFLLELESLFPLLMKNYMDKLQGELDLEKITREKIAAFPTYKLEALFNRAIKKEFRQLQLLGAGVGLVIGSVEVLLLALIKW